MTEAERIRGQHVDELSRFAENLRDAQAMLDRAVERARQSRMTWTQIGGAIGMTKQGARQRWI